MFGFAFKKDTGDTRESPAIYVARHLLDEGAFLSIYDPKVSEDQIYIDLSENDANSMHKESTFKPSTANTLRICDQNSSHANGYHKRDRFIVEQCPYQAAQNAHAIVLCTEWDEFKGYDYPKLYNSMEKPAFIFDGRKILNHEKLIQIGFRVETIGANLDFVNNSC